MSLKSLSEYTIYSRYAHYLPDKKRRETWDEITERVFAMHARRYATQLEESAEFKAEFEFAKEMVRKKRVLGSQRALQFGGRWIEDKNLRLFNCATTHINRPRAFQEVMYTLLCGTGMGFSVQKQHVKQLPNLIVRTYTKEDAARDGIKILRGEVLGDVTHQIADTIEGWADAVGALVSSYLEGGGCWPQYEGKRVVFDYSLIRPEGALIAGQFKAPGPKGLEQALEKMRTVLERRVASEDYKNDEFAGKLRPIDAYDLIMHSSDAVLSGGVRRSATISVFSIDDHEMAAAKTGNWFIDNPQRARSNNSAALHKGHVTKEQFHTLMEATKQYGEPGFIWLDNLDVIFNPCTEIAMIPRTPEGESGVQGCNLVEINGRYCDSETRFTECCRAAAFLGTIQAGYTNFGYLTAASKRIFDQEALLGCSITGIMDNPEVLLNKRIQQAGAKIILEHNARIAKIIGINPTARATCVKPAGSTSCVLETASGIHPHHAKRYLRRTQANRNEFALSHYRSINPAAVERSVWGASGTDEVISFACEVPKGAKLKNDISAVEFLSQIKLTQNNWVEYGTRPELCTDAKMRHNVSCTVIVRPDEWQPVEDYIFKHQLDFAGVSLLPASGDLDYPQAPFATVLTPEEIVREYGDGSILASGLVVDGLAAFDQNLWAACDVALGLGSPLPDLTEPVEPIKPKGSTIMMNKAFTAALADYAIQLNLYWQSLGEYRQLAAKKEWIRRVKSFADRYAAGDVRRVTYCLKHVSLWHTWLTLKRTHQPVDWSVVQEDSQEHVAADTLAAQACQGGACSI